MFCTVSDGIIQEHEANNWYIVFNGKKFDYFIPKSMQKHDVQYNSVFKMRGMHCLIELTLVAFVFWFLLRFSESLQALGQVSSDDLFQKGLDKTIEELEVIKLVTGFLSSL